MTIALIANALIGLFLISVIVALLGTAIARSRGDQQRLALVTRRRQARGSRSEHRSPARPRTGWAPRPDAF